VNGCAWIVFGLASISITSLHPQRAGGRPTVGAKLAIAAGCDGYHGHLREDSSHSRRRHRAFKGEIDKRSILKWRPPTK
jgi:hypothetical protein